jgi:dTDP-4-amino-4,6-dideoxygalactose transaminase
MKVPLLDLRPQLTQLRAEIIESVTNVIDSTRYIQGPEVEALEREIARYSSTDFGVGVSSGTDALLVSLMSLGVGQGDKVLTTPYSFFATMGVVLRLGATPVFADIDPVSYNIDPDQIDKILKDDTEKKIKAIIPVHLYGQCADMEKILSIAKNYKVPVIEDAAQAIGAEVPVKNSPSTGWAKAGSLGIAGCFSFFPSKNLGGIGDGGMVVSQDTDFANKTRLLRNHGAHPKYYHALVGGNFRLDPIQASVLRIKLKHLESWHKLRIKNALFYNECFQSSDLVRKGFVVPPQAIYQKQAEKSGGDRNYHIYNQYIIRVKKRNQLREWLSSKEIGTEIYYPLALHQQECLKDVVQPKRLPHAEKAAEETLALPIYPELTKDMQDYVVKSIAEFYR